MTCEDFQEQFVEYLLGELNPSDAQAVGAHLRSGCAVCNSDFDAIREGTELLFAAVPRAQWAESRHKEVIAHALRASITGPSTSSVTDTGSVDRSISYRQTSPLYKLLALAAGVALVLAIPLPDRVEQPRIALGNGLGGAVSAPKSRPKFVSFQDVRHDVRPEDPDLTGFLLVDSLSGEIHMLGSAAVPHQREAALALEIVTAREVRRYPLSFSVDGQCKALVPLPLEPVLKIGITHAAQPSSEPARPTNERKVS